MLSLICSISLCLFIGYCTGCLNPAYILARIQGFDIRTRGSGNAGASNALIIIGKAAGVFCALFDIFKAYLVVTVCSRRFSALEAAGLLAGVACILGHIYPVTMCFRGGKGLACIGGVLLAYSTRLFILLLMIEMVIVLVSSYICSVATSASVIFTIVLLIYHGPTYALLFSPVVIAVWERHMINFRRIRFGVEAKIRYFWKKQEEQERIQYNWNKLSASEKLYVNMPKLG